MSLLASSAKTIAEQEERRKVEFLVGQRMEKMLLRFDGALAAMEEKIAVLAEMHSKLYPGAKALTGDLRSSSLPSTIKKGYLAGKALVVDDEPINRTVLSTYLEKFGLEVEVAKNGIEALQKIEADDFLLVLMDIHMPEMSGFEATKMIRALEKRLGWRRVVIFAMTADGEETSRRKCFEVGMDDIFAKPIQAEILLERITVLLEAAQKSTTIPTTLAGRKKAQNSSGQELWSRTEAVAIFGGDEALFCELATVFLGRNDLLLQNIETAIVQKDAQNLLEAAHAYKGAVGYFACPTLRKSAIALENQAKTGRVTGGELHLARLRAHSELLCRDLSQLVLEKERG